MVPPKPVARYTVVGRSERRLDIPDKLTGRPRFVADMKLPGMLHGRVARPPSFGAKLESIDEATILAMPGVVAFVRDGDFLGVVAEREEQAVKARKAMIAGSRWTEPGIPTDASDIYRFIETRDTTDTVIVGDPSGFEIYEQQKGAIAVDVPSTLSRTIAFRGYLATLMIDPQKFVKATF
jgi:hypothetical protein